MSFTDAHEPVFTADGELIVGREVLDVPVTVRASARGAGATLELEARQAAASNRTVRLADLSAADVRRLRDELDRLLGTLE